MPGRITTLISEEIYHIYNRGNEKRDIFSQPRDYQRFLNTFLYYQYVGPKPSFSKLNRAKLFNFRPKSEQKLVEIIAFCLMPNHFHFILKQKKENGISIFISQLINSYTKYFNIKYVRVGALFQGAFKSVPVESDLQLIHLSRYIHLNPIVAGLTKNLINYPWSSYPEYIINPNLSNTEIVLNLFPSKNAYQKFTEDQIDYAVSLNRLKHTAIDLDY